jgi:hypothetical protein
MIFPYSVAAHTKRRLKINIKSNELNSVISFFILVSFILKHKKSRSALL